MLLIDGVKYEEWSPRSEDKLSEDKLEQTVIDHAKMIFGEATEYFNIKKRLESLFGRSRIPDGYIVDFRKPAWHIVEVELSEHPIDTHIREQVNDFITATEKIISRNRQKIVDEIFALINGDQFLRYKVEKLIASTEIHKFLTDLVLYQSPILTVIIEKKSERLEEELKASLRYSPMNILEFRIFRRVGAEAVHAHLFEPLYGVFPPPPPPPPPPPGRQVTVKNLIDANIMKVGQVIYKFYRGQRFEAKVLDDGRIELAPTGKRLDALSTAAIQITGKKTENGWRWWRTIHNGKECKLAELRKEYRVTHPSNP